MINRNMNWNIEDGSKEGNEPFLLAPAGKDYLWGGKRLKDEFSKKSEKMPLAETWECSTHPDGKSIVCTGKFAGMTLEEVLIRHPAFLGSHPKSAGGMPLREGQLPVLVKLIDAKQNLSIQVHPDDQYAARHENGEAGKYEMWYVLDAAKDAKLIYGFYHDMEKDEVRKASMDGSLETYLQKIPVKKNDVFFIPPGCVHAIGKGVLLAEVQENSNLTYRLYDYGRTDKDGKCRELHIEKALDVIDLKGSSEPRQPMRVLRFQNGSASELLCRCRYFQVEHLLVNTERRREMSGFRAEGNSFLIFLCTDGCGMMFWGREEMIPFYKGDCIFIPADSAEIKIHGQARFLKIGC